jgi:hypothetical protein
MTIRGNTHPLKVTIYAVAGGNPTDPLTLTLRVLRDGEVVHGPVALAGLSRETTGVFTYSWPIPLDAPADIYVAEWVAMLAGDPLPRTTVEVFNVEANATVGFVTVEAVKSTTGADVTDDNIVEATGIIGACTGVDFTIDPLPLRKADVRHLRTAIVWQAKYVKEHPDVLTREAGMTGANANGVSVSWGPGGSEGGLVAPLARMALRRLSWKGSRSVRMQSTTKPPAIPQTLTNDGADGAWSPLQ